MKNPRSSIFFFNNLLRFSLLMLLTSSIISTVPAQVLWTGDVDDDWFTAGNWEGGTLPGAEDDVVIANGDAVSLSGNTIEINSLSVTDNSSLDIAAEADLTVSGSFTESSSSWDISVYIGDGTSNLSNSGNITITGSGTYAILNEGTLSNTSEGTITSENSNYTKGHLNAQPGTTIANSGTLSFKNGASFSAMALAGNFTNNAGGTIDIEDVSGYGLAVVQDSFTNYGSLSVAGAGSTGIIQYGGTIVNESTGEIQVSDATDYALNLSSYSFTNNGTLLVSSTNAITASNFTNNGTLQGTGTYDLISNELDGTVIPGTSPGKMSFSEDQEFSSTSTLKIEVDGTTAETEYDLVDVDGTATISGTLSISINYTPTNGDRIVFLTADAISGTFSTLSSSLPLDWSIDYSVTGEVALEYDYTSGLWNGAAGDGEWMTAGNWEGSTLPGADDDVVIANGDAVSLSGNTIEINSLSVTDNSSLDIAAEADLTVSGSFTESSSSWDISIYVGDGTSSLSNSGNITITGSGTYAILNEGTLSNSSGGRITSENSNYIKGHLNAQPGTTITNSGTLSFKNGASFSAMALAGNFTNNAGGIIDIEDVSGYGLAVVQDSFTNYGSLSVAGAGSTGIIQYGGTIVNESTGEIQVSDATDYALNLSSYSFTNNGTLLVSSTNAITASNFTNNGTLQGTGTYDLISNELDGTVIPGTSPGKMSFSEDQEFSSTSTLKIEVDGTTAETEYDLVDVDGTATISGTLSISINYTPTNGDRIVFLTADAISGTFSDIDPELSADWTLDYSIEGEVALVYSGGVELAIKVILQGPYKSAEGNIACNPTNLDDFPTSLGDYTIADGVLDITGDNAIIDWVTVEIRDDDDKTSIIATRPALLQADGDVVDMDGTSALLISGVDAGDYYVVVLHRNHLGVMMAQVVTLE